MSVQIKVTCTESVKVAPILYPWLILTMPWLIVDCNWDMLNDLLGKGKAETNGADNLKTVRLVYAAYASAKNNQLIQTNPFWSKVYIHLPD